MKSYLNYITELCQEVVKKDPATSSVWQAYFFNPGVRALGYHYRAHKHYMKKRYFIARFYAKRARKKTGIEIHPGATIGRRVVIDHGMGVVIGESAIIGDDVLMYHGVTLGATGKEKGIKRHPTVESFVVLGTGATILGDITIGEGAHVGASSVVLSDVPAYTTAVGIPARIKKTEDK